MTQREIKFTVDPSILFDTIHAMKGNTEPLGTRLVEFMLADSGFIDRLGLAMYGVTVEIDGEPTTDDPAKLVRRLRAVEYLKTRYFEEMRQMDKDHGRRVNDLLEANNRYLERARAADRLLAELVDIEGPCPGTGDWARKVRAHLGI